MDPFTTVGPCSRNSRHRSGPRNQRLLRDAWSDADLELREWFAGEAARSGARPERGPQRQPVGLVGRPRARAGRGHRQPSRLGPPGRRVRRAARVVSAFAALDMLRERGFRPARPLGVACFTDEEGARFGVPCVGSRLLTGVLDARAGAGAERRRRRHPGRRPDPAGPRPARPGPRRRDRSPSVGTFVELHVEQGAALVRPRPAGGRGQAIWPHGRWRFDFHGRADHAGTTRLADRDDPMLPFAAPGAGRPRRRGPARRRRHDRQGRASRPTAPTRCPAWCRPGSTPAAPTRRTSAPWSTGSPPRRARAEHGRAEESWTPAWSDFDRRAAGPAGRRRGRRRRPRRCCRPAPGTTPASWPPRACRRAMLFVRNPTGVSHSPAEHAERGRLPAGVVALGRPCWRSLWR